MQFWMKAASALPYTDDVCWSMVVGLLDMASSDELLPHIPMDAWDWLNKRPVLPPECVALLQTTESVVQKIQQLGSIKLIVSYLYIILSEECRLWDDGVSVMGRLIKEELSGIGAAGHRKDLIQRLDYVLLQFDQGQGEGPCARKEYEELRKGLLEVDEEAMNILTGTSSSCRPFFRLLTHVPIHVQDIVLPSCAHSLFRAHSCVSPDAFSCVSLSILILSQSPVHS